MGSLFTELERRIIETSEEVCKKALESSAKDMKKSFKDKVLQKVSADYYADYQPTRYKRIGSLYKIWGVTHQIEGMYISLDFDADDKRMQKHRSGSKYHESGNRWISRYEDEFDWDSGDNGRPENSWILENFFMGKHPRYIVREGLVFDESYTYEDVEERLDVFIGKYQASGTMEDILVKHLKKECKKIKP